jgi:regulator of protease activity HflC (stomatin/prohibitin superfamily)
MTAAKQDSGGFARLCKICVLLFVGTWAVKSCFLTNVEPGYVGVRYSNAGGVLMEDLGPGWQWEITGLHRVWRMPSYYLFLNYSENTTLSIRTKDNNTVDVDISVPYRIIPGKAHLVLDAGNHLPTGAGTYRFERFANDTTISVLREHLAELKSPDFYNTDRRLKVSHYTLVRLNEALKPLHLEAKLILIRATYFRPAYEKQLAQIQLNEQQKLLDYAKEVVAREQQKFDNFEQQTKAMVSARDQDWARRIADLDRRYQVGFVSAGDDQRPGAARRALLALSADQHKARAEEAAKVFALVADQVDAAHLLGIKNIQAETIEYSRRVTAEADGIAARLTAEGDALVATVKGKFESKVNALLNSPAGRAYVAYRAADNVKFDNELVFQSTDGIPSILRLRDFALKFMGR